MAVLDERTEPVPSEFLAVCNECKAELRSVRLILESETEFVYVEGLGAVDVSEQRVAAPINSRFICLPCGHENSYKVWRR